METRNRGFRTASKNFQTFRFICRFESDNPLLTTLECIISFRIGNEWRSHINLQNIIVSTSFNLSYVFEELLDIKLQLLFNEKLIEEYEINLVHLVAKTHHALKFYSGTFLISIEEIKDNNSALSLSVNAKIKGGFLFWRPHYYIKMMREISPNDYLELYRSENTAGENCKWKKFTVPFNVIGDKSIKFSVFNTSDENIANTVISIQDLLTPGSQFILQKPNMENKGHLTISWAELQLQQNFIDYLRSGIKIKVIVAVDYTSSNMPYTMPESNHYLCEDKLNPYEASMSSVGKVLDIYKKDSLITFYGFGGIPKGKGRISHCFKLGTARNHNDLLTTYRNTLPDILLSKPTNLNKIIIRSQKHCQEDKDPMAYYVVLIITDGDIHDFPQTSTRIVYSCRYPVSYIIVGIGNADFKNMVRLDSDTEPLKDRDGRIAERDIVQFVPFNQYRMHPGLLASKVLEEIPEQICGYMKRRDN